MDLKFLLLTRDFVKLYIFWKLRLIKNDKYQKKKEKENR